MTTRDIHLHFRTVAQQMGMQTIRAILPEDIDIFVNNAIVNKVKEIISQSAIFNSNKADYDVKTSPISSIRNLYKTVRINNFITSNVNNFDLYTVIMENDSDVLHHISVLAVFDRLHSDCRIIDDTKLYDSLNDYLSQPTSNFPIALIKKAEEDNTTVEIYKAIDGLELDYVDLRYISYPIKIMFDESDDSGMSDVNTNIQDILIVDIINMAAADYIRSINSTAFKN